MTEKKIFKYGLYELTEQTVSMPKGAKILCIKLQGDISTMWAIVDPDAEMEGIKIKIFGTGWPIEGNPGKYLGTTIKKNGLVWHFFEAGKE